MRRILILLFSAVVIMSVLLYFKSAGNDTSDPSSSAPRKPSSRSSTSTNSSDKFLAYNYAEEFVEKRLKSPSTAKFPKTMERSNHVTILGGGKFKINSWVDSQNSFGATIRTNFTCTIIFEGNKVRCEEMVFQE